MRNFGTYLRHQTPDDKLFKLIEFGIIQDDCFIEKLDKVLPFLFAKDQVEAEDLFVEFATWFPGSERGEKQILEFFWNHSFIFEAFVPDSKFIKDVLRVLGDINEDGGSHDYKQLKFWHQVRNALLRCKDSHDKYSVWKDSLEACTLNG